MRRSAVVLAIALLTVVALVAPRAQAARSSDRLYVALGDSLAFGIGASDPATKGYAGQLFSILRAPGEWRVGSLRNLAVPVNETGRSILGGQLSAAVAAMNDPATDTRVVTLGIGGNDVGFGLLTHGPCAAPASRACGFVANYRALLRRLTRALRHDRGREALVVVTYYNPAQGTAQESSWDRALVGSDRRINCSGRGKRVGLNDLIACIGRRFGARVADIYPPLEGRIPELSAAGTHLNDAGYALVARVVARVLRHKRCR
jgi:acyl-CoA thioesterase-1